VNRQIPTERWSAFATAAAESRKRGGMVLIVCANRTVRRQYERAIPNLGGNLENVIFRTFAEPAA
jgi:hypothetical protein